MVQFEELRQQLVNIKPDLDDLADAINLHGLTEQLAELEENSSHEEFWNDMEKSQEVLQRIGRIKEKINAYKKLMETYDDTITLIDLALESGEEDVFDEVQQGADFITKELERQQLTTLLVGDYDANNAILTFHAGAGGTEAQDWAQMLYRMYTRWAERHGFTYKVLDYLDGDEAGLKSASILIEGENAYGFLKSEAGVHRLVRVSPFDASGRRHTSFSSLEVIPQIDDSVEVEIRPEDLRVDVYRSSGAGGQHVNKTSSAVRITHKPTGIVVACQNERSQFQNRDVAMNMLKSKLIEIKEREHLEKIEDIKGDAKEIAWGSQIRSYVFMPYTLAKDHRTGFESGNINAVMDGDIDGFINAYLKYITKKDDSDK